MSGADYSAAHAQAFGLVDEVLADPPALDAAVREFTALLTARSGITQRAVKETIARIMDGVTHDDESTPSSASRPWPAPTTRRASARSWNAAPRSSAD